MLAKEAPRIPSNCITSIMWLAFHYFFIARFVPTFQSALVLLSCGFDDLNPLLADLTPNRLHWEHDNDTSIFNEVDGKKIESVYDDLERHRRNAPLSILLGLK